jgi:hypothetical protein
MEEATLEKKDETQPVLAGSTSSWLVTHWLRLVRPDSLLSVLLKVKTLAGPMGFTRYLSN